MAPHDVQATLVALTAQTVARDIGHHAGDCQAVYVCGGGARNTVLLAALQTALQRFDTAGVRVETMDDLGMAPHQVEALASLGWRCATSHACLATCQASPVPLATACSAHCIRARLCRLRSSRRHASAAVCKRQRELIRPRSEPTRDGPANLFWQVCAYISVVNAYTENDEPQPQVVVAFGFLITNCAPVKSSL